LEFASDRGLIVKCWAGCDPHDVLAELRRRGLIGEGISASPYRVPRGADDHAARIKLAQEIWDRALIAEGSPVTAYLRGRGITVAPPPTLRWSPSLRCLDGSYAPGMVGRIDNVDGDLIGVHRTWLCGRTDGRRERLDRAMLGPVSGGAVRMATAAELLLIGEGVETGLAATQATGLPAWAALSIAGLVALKLPLVVRNVVILADHDRSGSGERSARAAARRWIAEGRRVRIAMPSVPDRDFNDILIGRDDTERHDVI